MNLMTEVFRSCEIREMPFPYKYDAVVVLTGQLAKANGSFRATRYSDPPDEFGMFGGQMRIIAAVNLYKDRAASTFVFSGGVPDKTRMMFAGHEQIPTEASVYATEFRKILNMYQQQPALRQKFEDLDAPIIIEEGQSKKTEDNIAEALALAKLKKWKRIVLVTNNFIVPRAEAHYAHFVQKFEESDIVVDFIGAEDYIRRAEPLRFDTLIDRYLDPESNLDAKRKLAWETNGIIDILHGNYVSKE